MDLSKMLNDSLTVFSASSSKQEQVAMLKFARQRLLPLWSMTSVSGGIKRRNYAKHQRSLPRLSVPPLQETLSKFLTTVEPLVSNDEEYQRTKKLLIEFAKPNGRGEQLQRQLEERASKSVNWLSEWWLNVAYLEYRLPCPIHVNPGILLPKQNFQSDQDQLGFASKLVAGILDYKVMVDEEKLPVEYLGSIPLCMNQYYKVLNSCRIPGVKHDRTVTYPHDAPSPPRHIVVMHNNHFFAVDMYSSAGHPMTVDQIAGQLQEVVSASPTPAPPIGILTSEHRNTWGKVHTKLLKDSHNVATLEQIQSSIFILCLDKPMPTVPPEDRQTMIMHEMNHGGGSQLNSANRWFDKLIQIIVNRDGAVGANYEHSTAEGPPIIALLDHAVDFALKHNATPSGNSSAPSKPKKLTFTLSTEIETAAKEAGQRFDVLINDLDMISWSFRDFGKNFIKSCKLSPDAFIQVSLQLAYYSLYGRSTASYESGSLRKFQEGRTDTIRSCSLASHRYCQAMCSGDSSVTTAQLFKLLADAINAHRQYTNDVVDGKGIDRHLLGLKMIAVESGENIPELFMDPVFNASSHWRLSTSQVASKFDAILSFAPVVPDGYGICYNPMEDGVNFSVSAWRSCPETDARRLANSLQKSLVDGRDLLLKARATTTTNAKL